MKPLKIASSSKGDTDSVSSSPISPSVNIFSGNSEGNGSDGNYRPFGLLSVGMLQTGSSLNNRRLSFNIDSPSQQSSSMSSLGFGGISHEDYEPNTIESGSSSDEDEYDVTTASSIRRSSFEKFIFRDRKQSVDLNSKLTLKNENSNYLSPVNSKLDEFCSSSNSSSSHSSSSALVTDKKEPNLLRKLVTRASSSLKPQLKSFRRITYELQAESSPLDSEMRLEAVVTHALKDEDAILNRHRGASVFSGQPTFMNDDILKKNELITKANKAWNHTRKDSFNKESARNSLLENSDSELSSIGPTETPESTASTEHVKRKNTDDEGVAVKRRAVSTSPGLASRPFLGSRKIMQATSEDLEKMKLS